MAIVLTEQEKTKLKVGDVDVAAIIKARQERPCPREEMQASPVDSIKKQIRETNLLYKEAIQKNRDLYNELVGNRKIKEELRAKLSELRKRKKAILGTE